MNDYVDDKGKHGIHLHSLPEEFRFIDIMRYSRNKDSELICDIFKADDERRKGFQKALDASAAN